MTYNVRKIESVSEYLVITVTLSAHTHTHSHIGKVHELMRLLLLCLAPVSRKRKKKNWEEDDYYDSDDDSFLDRTGTVERKRKERMKKAGKIQERPETYDSLVNNLFYIPCSYCSTLRL